MEEHSGSLPLELSIGRLKDNQGRTPASVAISRDLSHIPQMVQTISRTNERLPHEIAVRQEVELPLRKSENA